MFKPYFEAEYDLTVDCAGKAAACAHEADPDGNIVYDNDTHFLHVGRDDWANFTYGAKLWGASSCQDPELQKLVRLFELLKSE